MKLCDLLNTCQNQYGKNLFDLNKLFTITLLFEDKSDNSLESNYILKSNFIDDHKYILDYRSREVNYWYALGRNDLVVEIKGHY